MPANEAPPKVFISYSWSSTEHQDWVVELAQRLTADGVHVFIDVWDLKEGQDKYAFMERMVTDPEIKRVLVILDKRYAEKADKREGGVGSESQIISGELYQKVEHQKFVPIVAQRDGGGAVYAPVFLKNRIYVDLSSKEGFADEYDKLLRNIYERPARQRPALGRRPDSLDSVNPVSPAVHFRLEELERAIETGSPNAVGQLRRFLSECLSSMEAFRIQGDSEVPLDDRIMDSIRQMKPLRDELIRAFSLVGIYTDDPRFYEEFHAFFERAASYMFRPKSVNTWNALWFDNYGFFLRECFLYLAAILLKERRFERFKALVSEDFCYTTADDSECETFAVFDYRAKVLEDFRNQRLQLNLMSVTASVVQERADSSAASFNELMQADVMLTLTQLFAGTVEEYGRRWFPRTSVYLERSFYALPLFKRIESGREDKAVGALLGTATLDELGKRYIEVARRYDLLKWRFDHWSIPFYIWMGLRDWLQRHPQ